MIAHVRGTVTEKFGSSIIVDVQGIGYEIQVSSHEYDSAIQNAEITLFTYHHIREQSQDLYGFSSLAAKRLFEMLITVQGVGPKAAISILSVGTAEQVRNAIANADNAFVSQASGIGKKIAERVVVDLRDKVGLPVAYPSGISIKDDGAASDDAAEALMALGYSLADATRALTQIDTNLTTSERVRAALRETGR